LKTQYAIEPRMNANERELGSKAINLNSYLWSLAVGCIGFYSRVSASIRGSKGFGLNVKSSDEPRMNANERELGSKAINLNSYLWSLAAACIGFYSRVSASIRGSKGFGLNVKSSDEPRMNANERELGSKAINLKSYLWSLAVGGSVYYLGVSASIRGSRPLCL